MFRSYYFQVIASKKGGSLNLLVNAKMFQTSLTDQVTSFVFNDEQTIVLNSSVVPETYVISSNNFQPLATGQSEIQQFLIQGSIGQPFMLQFAGVTTGNHFFVIFI